MVPRYHPEMTCRGGFRGTLPAGKRVALTGGTIARFAAGRVAARWSEADLLGPRQRLGAIPAPEASG